MYLKITYYTINWLNSPYLLTSVLEHYAQVYYAQRQYAQ